MLSSSSRFRRRGLRVAGALAFPLVLAGCITPDPPKYDDALAGLSSSVAANAPVGARASVRGPAALVVSENTEKMLESHETVEKGLRAQLLVNESAAQSRDPTHLVNKIVALVKTRVPNIELVDDLATASRRGKKSTIVVDLRSELGKLSGQRTNVAVTLVFMDERQRPVSRITGQGSAVIPYPAFSFGFQEAADQALQDLAAKMDAVLR